MVHLQLSKPLFLVALVAALFLMPSCEKDEPEPILYTPEFEVIYHTAGADLIFLMTCTTDDVEVTKIEVSAPGSAEPRILKGPLMASVDVPFTFNDPFQRASGNWTFHFHGRVRSGEYVGVTFMVTKVVNVVV